MNQKQFRLIEAQVLIAHGNKITETSIVKKGKRKQCWQTKLPDGCRPRCYSYENLIERLYEFYFGEELVTDFSFRNMFERALDEKIKTEMPKSKTIKDYWDSYHAFISEEFGAKDIRRIAPSEVKTYLQEVTHRLKPTKKRLYKFKGVLNLAFRYAADPERRYIDVNPVPASNRAYTKNCTPISRKPEDKAFQPEEVELIRQHLWKRVRESRYDVNGYAILFASETGCREAEIPALKWSDVYENRIHIHAQLNDHIVDGVKKYYYNGTTKDEKGVSRDGRNIPLTTEIRKILTLLKEKQDALGIKSEWVFCKESSDWITTAGYCEALYRLCKKLGLKLSNNHAFRMALNSYVYVPMGLDVATRAKILGHSVETNLQYYTLARTDDYLDTVAEMLNNFNQKTR